MSVRVHSLVHKVAETEKIQRKRYPDYLSRPYLPFGQIKRRIPPDEKKVIRALGTIVHQIEEYKAKGPLRARVTTDDRLKRDFGIRVAECALSRLTPEQWEIRNRALIVQKIVSSKSN